MTVLYVEHCATMRSALFRLAYLDVTNAYALLQLLPLCDRDKNTEIAPGRKYLQLTEAGHAELLRRRELWQQFSSTVHALAHCAENQEHRNA